MKDTMSLPTADIDAQSLEKWEQLIVLQTKLEEASIPNFSRKRPLVQVIG